MIRINLLPVEYRRKAKTPLNMLVAVAASVAINASLFAWWSWLHFGVAAEVETEKSVMQLELDGLVPLVQYHESLGREVKYHSAREETLAQVTKERVVWTKVLDELIDLVHLGGEGVRHYIWFDDLRVRQEEARPGGGGGRGQASYGHIKAQGHSGSEAWDQVAAFLRDFEDPKLSEFPLMFMKPSPPEGEVNDRDEDLVPAVNWAFPMSLDLRSPDERQEAKEQVAASGQSNPKGEPK